MSNSTAKAATATRRHRIFGFNTTAVQTPMGLHAIETEARRRCKGCCK